MAKIIDFNLMKINKNAQKICRCDPPNYEIDTTNRLVKCTKCNAYIKPFDALLYLAKNYEQYQHDIERLQKKRNCLAVEVNELFTKRLRMNVFRNLQNSYMSGMLPHCPCCKEPFDPTEINNYTNKDYCNHKKKDEKGAD